VISGRWLSVVRDLAEKFIELVVRTDPSPFPRYRHVACQQREYPGSLVLTNNQRAREAS